MTYLRDCWYIASWTQELETSKPVSVTILDAPVVVYRGESGQPYALYDRCPHRFAPLSLGKVEGDTLRCGYHGLGFNGAGACAVNPHGPVLKSIKVQSFPVHEAHRAVWIWMGEPEKADISLIPDFGFFDDIPDSAFTCGLIYTKGNYELFSDNLLDLSHADFLHATTVLGAPFASIASKVKEDDEGVSIEYTCFDEVPNVLMRKAPGLGDRLDQRVRMTWEAPGAMVLRIEFVPAGSPEGTPATSFRNVHALTPETATSTHYFFASTRNFLMDDAALNDAIGNTRKSIFEAEDSSMIAAQQSAMGDKGLWELNPLMFRGDNAGVRARRILERRIRDEQAGEAGHEVLSDVVVESHTVTA
jgi:nitrite reductase/ring-hydroxylating ferredoxin subunit